MPEQVKPTTLNQVGAGELHDLPYPFPVAGAITMNLAMFTGRFRLEWTTHPPLDGISEEFLTFGTDQDPRQSTCGELLAADELLFRSLMVAATIDTGKPDQHFQVFEFLWVKCRKLHTPSLTNTNHRSHDLDQNILHSHDKLQKFVFFLRKSASLSPPRLK
jgi:hypothetical protein